MCVFTIMLSHLHLQMVDYSVDWVEYGYEIRDCELSAARA